MNSNIFIKGDILEATDRNLTRGVHYIIYFEGHSNSDFCGCMITHSSINGNCLMNEIHFKTKDDFGKYYKIVFDNTHLVLGKFLKSEEWGPFKKVGSLSGEGIDFVNKHITHLDSETFRDYYRKYKLIQKI